MTRADGAARPGHGDRPIRLAELLVSFSVIADLGMGLPAGEAARTALVAVQLARRCGCPEREASLGRGARRPS